MTTSARKQWSFAKIGCTKLLVSEVCTYSCMHITYRHRHPNTISLVELVPRFYLEVALLKCYKFSCQLSGFPAILERLTLMIRGIGNPQAVSFARLFLVHTAEHGEIFLLSFSIFFFFFKINFCFSFGNLQSFTSQAKCLPEL